MAQCVTTYVNRGAAVCHIYGVRHLCKLQRQVWSFKHDINHKLNTKERYCLINRCIFCVNNSKCEQSVRKYFTTFFFFLLCNPAGSKWLLDTICTKTLSRNVFFYVSINYKFTYKFTDLSGGTYRSNWLYPRQKRTDVEIFFDKKKKLMLTKK